VVLLTHKVSPPGASRARIAAMLFFFLLPPAPSLAQDSTTIEISGAGRNTLRRSPVVSRIVVFGNKTTKSEIILRELTVREGDTIDSAKIEYCRERIYSLGLFNKVDIDYPPLDSTVLVVDVDERWYFFPVPLLGVIERDIGKWYYGLGVVHYNLSGWNDKLFAGFVLGYNPWVSLSYSNPWIFGTAELYSETSLGYNSVHNKSLLSRGEGPNFLENRYSAQQTIGKRFDPFRSAQLSIGYQYLEVTEKKAGRTISPDGIDRFLTLAVGARYDTRNLREYPTSGAFISATVVKKGIGFGDVDFAVFGADARVYRTVFDLPSIAVRVFSRIGAGPAIPNYEHQFFGFGERLRGHFSEEVEGESIAGANLEVRIPLIRTLYVRFAGFPIPEFAMWKFGLYAAAFVDAGMVWNKGDDPTRSRVPSGYGGGLHLLLPYGFVVRFERAWSESGRGEWIAEVGASF
jgi:outer membrane protein assembly factor BamA